MEVFIGTIQMFGFNFAPRGWALCNGQMISVSQNTALFSLLGTYFGGNGQTTFGIPNLQSRLPVGQGTGPGLTPRVMGEASGTESVLITTTNLPPQTIPRSSLPITTTINLASAPSNALTAPTTANSYIGASAPSGPPSAGIFSDTLGTGTPVPLNGVTTTLKGDLVIPGGGQPISLMNPFLAVNFSIALQGIFPSRN
ncbi:tail fiber protein [Pseudomonas fuscovaginae UPB0736]|uniref:phage tail protein n=1 Tax=Pseudomonas asplenii TaxID=53407 RepID=UPI0002884AC6|nr:tail fiber protein [Pseudomonas fuscovaginae]UUQ67426.1 tail fiber protein [Pseudomonas fuscovaginae UPB0736]